MPVKSFRFSLKGFCPLIQLNLFIELLRLFLLHLLLSYTVLEFCPPHPSFQVYQHKIIHNMPTLISGASVVLSSVLTPFIRIIRGLSILSAIFEDQLLALLIRHSMFVLNLIFASLFLCFSPFLFAIFE